MEQDKETRVYTAELSQPSGVSQLECKAESDAVAWATLLKEALSIIQTDNCYDVRMKFHKDCVVGMRGDEILNQLLSEMACDNCLDTDWLLRNWESKCARFATPYDTEYTFVSYVLTNLMREQGYAIHQESDPVYYDTWKFQLVDEQGKELEMQGVYTFDPLPYLDEAYSGGNCEVKVWDELDKLCIQMPFTEYSFLLAYGGKADPALKLYEGDWLFEETIVRAGATNGFVLLHYPEYIAYLKEKGWSEIPRSASFKAAVESLWNEGKPLVSITDVPQIEPLSSIAAVEHCLGWVKAQQQRQQEQQSVSDTQ